MTNLRVCIWLLMTVCFAPLLAHADGELIGKIDAWLTVTRSSVKSWGQEELMHLHPLVLMLCVENKGDVDVVFKSDWLDPAFENFVVTRGTKTIGVLSPFGPPGASDKKLFSLAPGARICLSVKFPDGSLLSREAEPGSYLPGEYVVRWIHHPDAVCRFRVNEDGSIDELRSRK